MKAAILLATLALMLIAAVWSANAALAVAAVGLFIEGVVVASLRAYRQVEKDFPESWNQKR